MNIIVVMLDSLRLDHVGCYGNDWIETPNLDRFAEMSVVFDDAYVCGLPTIPVRTELFTGECTLPYRPWQPLAKEDIAVAQLLREHSYLSVLIADTYHLFKPDMNFHRGFTTFRWIRGQEADAYRSCVPDRDISDFISEPMRDSHVARMLVQYLQNTTGRESEDDYFCAMVMNEAIAWLDDNATRGQPFFLWIDSFDPHEPWDPPPPFDTKYTDPSYRGKQLIHPKYGPVDWMSDEELKCVRALYAGEVSFVDKCFGRLLDRIESLGLVDNTLIVVLSDHGHPHGDHGIIMKSDANLYQELVRFPLMIHHPAGQGAGTRCDALLQMYDILPTILDIVGLTGGTTMHGRSVWPVVCGECEAIRDHVICGYHASPHRSVRDREWAYIARPTGQQDELYKVADDPTEQRNVITEFPREAARLASYLGRYSLIGKPRTGNLQLDYEVSHTPAQ